MPTATGVSSSGEVGGDTAHPGHDHPIRVTRHVRRRSRSRSRVHAVYVAGAGSEDQLIDNRRGEAAAANASPRSSLFHRLSARAQCVPVHTEWDLAREWMRAATPRHVGQVQQCSASRSSAGKYPRPEGSACPE